MLMPSISKNTSRYDITVKTPVRIFNYLSDQFSTENSVVKSRNTQISSFEKADINANKFISSGLKQPFTKSKRDFTTVKVMSGKHSSQNNSYYSNMIEKNFNSKSVAEIREIQHHQSYQSNEHRNNHSFVNIRPKKGSFKNSISV